jgi:small subunit ribosomal protein S6
MPEKASYDLMVMLDPEAPEERRTELIGQIRGQIESGATLKGDADWGMRKLAYEIDHRTEAQYHLYQFESAPDLLSSLDRGLSIDDAVLRFRIIRLKGDAPEETPKSPPQVTFESGRREGRDGREGRGRDDRGDRGDRGDRRPSESRPEQAADVAEEPTPPAGEAAAAEAPAAAPAPEPAAVETPEADAAPAPAETPAAEPAPADSRPAGDTA